jgi:hypothetical protein
MLMFLSAEHQALESLVSIIMFIIPTIGNDLALLLLKLCFQLGWLGQLSNLYSVDRILSLWPLPTTLILQQYVKCH